MSQHNDNRDHAGVVAPPPLIALAAVVLGLLLDRIFPAFVLSVLLTSVERLVLGGILMAAGFGLIISANLTFRARGTPPEPWKPVVALVTNGIFGWMRNPMYVGGTLFLAGLAIALASSWMLVTTILSAFVLHFGVVKREERYLAARFGEPYRRYMASVPRYGWPG
jgi:protein-S-isoprenylcysteine O-methyltransferase Ste14